MTKRKQSRSSKSRRRQTNPLERAVVRPGRPRISFNGQDIYSTLFVLQSAVGSVTAKVGADWQSVDCSDGQGMNRAATDVVKHYQEYRYVNAHVEWVPFQSPASTEAGSTIYMAYIDNPELIVTFKAASDAVKLATVKNTANCKSFNAWERYNYTVPLTYRRKWFNVNPSIGTPSAEETDRSIQGLVIIGYSTISNTVGAGGLGQFRLTSTTRITGFTATTLT